MEFYFSVDIEADGPCPGVNSMLSLGCAAFSYEGKLIETFSANLERIPGACQDPFTMRWWKTQPEAWEKCRVDAQPATVVMPKFHDWAKEFEGPKVVVAYPAGFDFTYLYYYLHRFVGDSIFSFSALDIKTYAMAAMRSPSFKKSVKKNMPKEWIPETKHSHIAVEDAIEQGELFFNIRNSILKGG